jgi:hypothetical protein
VQHWRDERRRQTREAGKTAQRNSEELRNME